MADMYGDVPGSNEEEMPLDPPLASEKSPVLTNMLEQMYGRSTSIDKGECIFCHKPVGKFRDAISRKEYSNSGMCQTCQDGVFG